MEQSVWKYCFNLFECTASEYLAAIRLTCAADRYGKKKTGDKSAAANPSHLLILI
jgi:hypothetical protein